MYDNNVTTPSHIQKQSSTVVNHAQPILQNCAANAHKQCAHAQVISGGGEDTRHNGQRKDIIENDSSEHRNNIGRPARCSHARL